MKKKKIEKTIDINRLRIHTPNKFHLEACKRGGRIHKNKKAYTRKEKHPRSY